MKVLQLTPNPNHDEVNTQITIITTTTSPNICNKTVMGTYIKTKININISLNKKLAIDLQTDRNIYPHSDIRKQNKT